MTVRSFEGNRSTTNIGPNKDSSGVIHSANTSKANALNSFFVNVGKSLLKSTQDSLVNSPCQSARSNNVIPTLFLHDIALNKNLLKSSLKCLKPGKASGPDSISSKALCLIGDTFFRLLYATVSNKNFGVQIPKPVETGTSEMSSQEREHSQLQKLLADSPSKHSGQAIRECC